MENLVHTPAQLATILRARRHLQGMTQDEAGRRVGLLRKTVSALENNPGPSSIDTLFKCISSLDLEFSLSRNINPTESWLSVPLYIVSFGKLHHYIWGRFTPE